MRLRPVFLLVLVVSVAGCSPSDWTAKFQMFRAEEAVNKAYLLKSKKRPYEERLRYYRSACEYFVKAYESSRDVYTLTRIEEAIDACWRADKIERKEMFMDFEQKYIKAHPQEYEYGDSGVNMMDMGS